MTIFKIFIWTHGLWLKEKEGSWGCLRGIGLGQKLGQKFVTNFWANPVFQTLVEMTQVLSSEQTKSYDLWF